MAVPASQVGHSYHRASGVVIDGSSGPTVMKLKKVSHNTQSRATGCRRAACLRLRREVYV